MFEQMGARDVAVVDCVITNTGATGIALNGIDHAFVADNLIYHTGYALGWSSGISSWYGEYGGANAASDDASGSTTTSSATSSRGSYDNSFHHSDGHGIIVDGSGSIPPALIAKHRVRERAGPGSSWPGSVAKSGWSTTWLRQWLSPANQYWIAADFMAVSATVVHFVKTSHTVGDAGGRSRTKHQKFDPVGPQHGLPGRTTGVSTAVIDDGTVPLRQPRFVRFPPVPSGPRPGARAVPPWQLGRAFRLRGRSPAIATG